MDALLTTAETRERLIKLGINIMKSPFPERWNLTGANLSSADLSGADFTGVCLRGANFREATLRRAFFEGAKLEDVDFRGADLTGAYLGNANLRGVDFRKAILSRVTFSGSDLMGANLCEADLSGLEMRRAVLRGAILNGAKLRGTNLMAADIDKTNLRGVDLRGAILIKANLRDSDLRDSDLTDADLSEADLSYADLRGAKLCSSRLTESNLVRANIVRSDLTGCEVYGVSAWDIRTGKTTKMKDLIISIDKQPLITVDDIEVAQFIYMILDNKKVKKVIDTMRTKAILILGAFDKESILILETLKDTIRSHGYLPLLCEFKAPRTQELMETVKTMALLSSFVIVDLSKRSGQLHELSSLVKDTYIPFATIARDGTKITAMHGEFKHYYWYKDRYFSYSPENAVTQIPQLFEKEIIPWANIINNRIRYKRKSNT
jgi:uncharacterized protein YjbI with pentapeptide repeats